MLEVLATLQFFGGKRAFGRAKLAAVAFVLIAELRKLGVIILGQRARGARIHALHAVNAFRLPHRLV